jgi:hypothetical protein
VKKKVNKCMEKPLKCIAKMYAYWQQLDAESAVAAEVKHAPADNKMDLSTGYSHMSLDGTL